MTDAVERGMHVGRALARRARDGALLERTDHLAVGRALPQPPAHARLVQHDPDGEHVGPPIEDQVPRLLRRHVEELALDRPVPRLGRAPLGLRDAEVDHLHLTVVRHEDVVGRHVSMDDVERRAVEVLEVVRMLEPDEHVCQHREVHLERERLPRPREDAMQRRPSSSSARAIRIYLDGAPVATCPLSEAGLRRTSSKLRIGANWVGMLDDLRVYAGDLSDAELLSLAKSR
jgi:hypothetical protein